MSNMSYCRFQNTAADLGDCAEHINDDDLSPQEERARTRLIKLCKDILEDSGWFVLSENEYYGLDEEVSE